jgi:hypothetical protein
MYKKKQKIGSTIVVAALLIMPLTVCAAVPMPHGIKGIVYMSDGVTEVPAGTSFSVNDTTSGFFIEGTAGAGPHSGWYSVSINGNEGDTVIIRAWNTTHYGERTVILVEDMTGIDVIINRTLGPEPTVNVFDTGAPDNPYPSIAGTHNGTLKPNVTINVTTLYTYQCAGTGGHTEYAKIYNDSWNIETLPWTGYNGDWYNITFNETFTLLANETYYYTIRTGSYPQIHHTKALLTTNGWLNCTEFTDVNGKVYKDWIPAIKLE